MAAIVCVSVCMACVCVCDDLASKVLHGIHAGTASPHVQDWQELYLNLCSTTPGAGNLAIYALFTFTYICYICRLIYDRKFTYVCDGVYSITYGRKEIPWHAMRLFHANNFGEKEIFLLFLILFCTTKAKMLNLN